MRLGGIVLGCIIAATTISGCSGQHNGPPPAGAPAAFIANAQSKLPAGTRVYKLAMIHVWDPIRRIQEDFPADSLVMRSSSQVVVTPPGRGATVFSSAAQVTRDPGDVMYFYVRPGQQPSAFVREHATRPHR